MSMDLMPGQMQLYIGRELPMLPIAADLLPPEIVNDRRDRKVRGVMIVAVVAFTAVLGGFFAVTKYQTALAEEDLTNAQGEVTSLTQKQRDYQELNQTKSDSKKITDQLKVLLAKDLQWGPLLSAIRGIAPDGVIVTGMTASLAAGDPQANPNSLPKTYTEKQVGTIMLAGTAADKAQIAAFSEALGQVKGLGDPLVTGVSATEDGYRYGIQVDITAAALGGRYTPASASPSPSK
jgi:Tfp pilus assembly protein PilN